MRVQVLGRVTEVVCRDGTVDVQEYTTAMPVSILPNEVVTVDTNLRIENVR